MFCLVWQKWSGIGPGLVLTCRGVLYFDRPNLISRQFIHSSLKFEESREEGDLAPWDVLNWDKQEREKKLWKYNSTHDSDNVANFVLKYRKIWSFVRTRNNRRWDSAGPFVLCPQTTLFCDCFGYTILAPQGPCLLPA